MVRAGGHGLAGRWGSPGRLAFTFALGAAACSAQAHDLPLNPAAIAEDDLLLFQVHLDQTILSESCPALPAKGGYLVPLGELCRELDLAIQVDPARGLAEGFIIQEARPFRLDVAAGTVTVGKVTTPLDRAQLDLRPDDLYLDTRLLSQCLPLDLVVDARAATITVRPREPLPLQQRLKRAQDGSRLHQDPGQKTFEPMADPYRLVEVPAVDLTLESGVTPASGGGSPFFTQGSLVAAGDFLHLSTSAYLFAQDPGGVSNAYLTMGRRDPHAGLLGPLHATEFAFGEVASQGLNLATYPLAGTGVSLSSYPLQLGNNFDRHSFQGELPQGWQVELYQNQGLVAFQGSGVDGRYSFPGIPLYYGVNEFRLVFYGPQGQRREETTTYDVSRSQTPPGAFFYEVGGLKPLGVLGRRTEFQASYGLTPQVSAIFGTALVPLGAVDHTYSEAGLQGFWKPLSGSLIACADAQGGAVTELGLRTRLGVLTLGAKEAELRNGFQSEAFPQTSGPIQSRTSLEVSATVPSLQRPVLFLDAGGFRDQLAAGGTADNVHTNLTTSLGGVFLSNQTTHTLVRPLGMPSLASATGEFLISVPLRAIALRGQATYNLTGTRQLTALALMADLPHWAPYTFQASVTHTLPDEQTILNLGMIKTQGAYGLGANLAYSNLTRLTANLTFRLGLTREPRTHQVFAKAQSAANTGAVSAQAFVDSNGNGIWDPGEKPVPKVAFLVNGARSPHPSDASGVALLEGFPDGVDAEISVDPSSLEDPLMHPEAPGVRVTSRAGHVARLEMPIIFLSEINGTTYLVKAGVATPLPGLQLELKDVAGKVVKRLRSAYDGFYTFGDLPAGSYTLGVAEAGAQRLGVPTPPPRPLNLAPEGSILDGVDFRIEMR